MSRKIAVSWLLLVASPAAGEHFYLHSDGRRVDLTLAPDRIAVVLAPGAAERLETVSGVDPAGSRSILPNSMTLLPLDPAHRGMGESVALRLVEAGLARRAGMVFSVPGTDKTFSLDREVLVKLRDPAAAEALSTAGLEPLFALDNHRTLLVCRAADARAALRAAVAAARLRQVAWAIPDFSVPVELYHRPNDPYYGLQWHHYQVSDADIDSEEAWDVTMGDSRVVVAVIDTGVDLDHPDFNSARMVTGYNAVTGGSDPTPLAGAVDAHGTACSGEILAEADNNEGMSGVCPRCSLMAIKMMDGNTTQSQLSSGYRAIDFAANNGAWVLSNSWGIDESVIGQVDIQPYYDAVRHALNNGRGGTGAVVLFASGNGDMMGNRQPIGRRELQNLPEVMAVGGTGPDDRYVSYSDYGPNLAVTAPTGRLGSGFGGMFDGPQICTTDTVGNRGFSRGGYYYTPGLWGGDQRTDYREPDSSGNYTQYFNGTSAACPIAAGVVALAWSANLELTGPQVRMIVERTADKVGGPYDADGHSNDYGYGRVNANRAVRVARAGLDNPDGAVCAEDLNCRGGNCAKASPGDLEGVCATPCASDADCAPGQTCAALPGGPKACLPACSRHQDCEVGAVCQDGACMVLSCADGNDCPQGTACPPSGEGRSCKVACAGDSECSPPALCLPALGGDLCQAIACTDGSECPQGTACPKPGGTCARTCASDRDCADPALCLPALGGDLCQTIACTDGSECPQGTACPADGGTCLRVCSSNADCLPPALCLPAGKGDLCLQVSCAVDGDCPQGTRCVTGGFCFPTDAACQNQDDCPPGWECRRGKCLQPGESGGGGCACGRPAGAPIGAGLAAGALLLLLAARTTRKKS